MWNGGGSAQLGSPRLVLLLALACCTYAPLNHEMQSNLRSSNGKYCLRHPPATSTSTPPPPSTLHFKEGGGKATQSSCQCASVCQLELTASHRSVQLNFEFSVLDFSNCTDRGQRQEKQQWQQQRRSSTKRRELMKRIHMSTSISVLCSGFFASVEVFATRVAQISYFLAQRVAESTRLPRPLEALP